MSNSSTKMWSGRFRISISLAALAVLSAVAKGQTVHAHCSQQKIGELETEAESIRDWAKLRSFYHRYSICQVDDAEVTQGVSTSVVQLLIDHWNSLSVAQDLFKRDRAFESFAIAGLNVTDLTEDLDKIDKLASEHCPNNLHTLCKKIRTAIRTNN